MVNLELYRVFYTVARCGSLTRAADELFISQPAVSQSIKQLEGQLGCSLFNRTHRGMELSEQGGKQIFDIVEKALGELGYEYKFVRIEWNKKVIELNSGNIDLIWNGRTITEELQDAREATIEAAISMARILRDFIRVYLLFSVLFWGRGIPGLGYVGF